jgi:hypothetical protein
MASTYLSRTCGSTASSYTVSMWVRTAKTQGGTTSALWWNAATNKLNWEFNGSSQIYCYTPETRTAGYYRDVGAWYHLVWSVNSNVGTLYVNGVADSGLTNVSSIASLNSTNDIQIGGDNGGSTFDGSMSHVHFIDGTAYDATAFGEYDANGVWTINTSPSVTYGTNGFFILKDGNSVTDQSGNSNNLTVAGGTLTNTEDSPSNVFATLNPLIKPTSGTPTFGNGNTTYKSTATGWDSGLSTIMPSSGKWYFEVRPQDNDNTMIGLVDVNRNPEFLAGTSTYGYLGYKGLSYQSNSGGSGVVYRDNSNAYTGLSDWSANDTCGVAIDLDNQEMFLHINGTYTNSGNPATRTNPYDFSSVVNSGNSIAMGVSSRNNFITYVNFGNGYFQTTAVASAGTNASGIGIFEYDVPTGYTALSTKGLNL